MELFRSICDSLEVAPEIASDWMNRIVQQYSGEKRYFHNVQLLEKKFELVEELAEAESSKQPLILAITFQYFHYDVKRDLKQENCDVFKLFIDQSGIKDVSVQVLKTVEFHFNIF